MSAIALAAVLLAATMVGLLGVVWLCVDTPSLQKARKQPGWLRSRGRSVAPYLGGLALVLLINKGLQAPIDRISQTYGIEATPILYAIEGDIVVWFQELIPGVLLAYFVAVYTVGYAVLLVAPAVVYFFGQSVQPIRRLLVAYTVNYALAVPLYAAVVAYGPRNADRGGGSTSADATLLEFLPDISAITVHINSNTNVFPSLHASLSVTVLLLAWTTRAEFDRWFGLATVLGGSIVVSTTALGIHWATDVVAGIALAVVAVTVATRVVD